MINNIIMDLMQLEWLILELKWIKQELNKFLELFSVVDLFSNAMN
jgi:hypothetical protein